MSSPAPMPASDCGKAIPKGFSYEDMLRYGEVEQGVIRIGGAVREKDAETWLREIAKIKAAGHKTCKLIISSPGGGAYPSLALYDALRDLSDSGCKIEALVEGCAASAAAMIILQAADVRRTRSHSRFLLHECRRWVFWSVERTSDIRDEAKEMEALSKTIWALLAARCGKSVAEVEAAIERKEVWMAAEEAKEWGLIDEIV